VDHERSGSYQTMVRITAETDKRSRTVAGTLFGKKPRIVEVGGIQLEAGLGAHMLYINNDDKPGLIGSLGSLLGKHSINIACFNLGRHAEGDEALALIEVDQPVSQDILAEIAALAGVRQVKALQF